MRVAVISAHTCPLAALGGKETGGMNVYVRETCRELGRRGVEVDIFTRAQDPQVPRGVSLSRGVRVFHIPAGPETPYDKYRLLEHLREFVEGVYAHGNGGYDLVHSHYWISGLAALELRERWRVPMVHMFHTLGYLKNRVARTQVEQERWIRLHWEWEVACRADALVAAQPLERAQLIWHYDAPPKKVRVIPCGVNLSLFQPIDKSAALKALGLETRPWLLFVGRLEPIKGLDTLLKAMSLIRHNGQDKGDGAALLIIGGEKNGGDPSEMDHWLREQVKCLGLQDRVFFMGSRPQVDLPLFFAASEACILPSRYESFGMVALESMACGTPVIASHVGGLSYTVQDGQTGFLVAEGDAETLADRIQNVLKDPILQNQLARKAFKRAQDFNWGRITEALLKLYRGLRWQGRDQAPFTEDDHEKVEGGIRP